MVSITTKEITDISVWENFLSAHEEANFLQSWYWGAFHERLYQTISRIGFYRENQLVGVVLAVVEDAKRGRYLTVPGGPIISWEERNVIDAFVETIKTLARTHRCVFVRVRPQLTSSDHSKQLFREHGFRDAPMHLHAQLTSELDITKTLDELSSNLRKTTRYEIKKARNEGIVVSSTANPTAIQSFYDLQMKTAKRQGFVPFSYKYLYEQFCVFSEVGHALLYSAHLNNALLAQAFIIFYGTEAVYHYGASTDEGRRHPGAYLLQWEAIEEAKRRGVKKYNFWGVAPLDQPHHRFYGVSVFKRGFGGEEVSYLHAKDLVINPILYTFASSVELIRKKLRHV